MNNDNKKQNKKRMPKSYYETPEGSSYLTMLYRDHGMTDQEVADEIGYSRRTIYNWRNTSKTIDNAINLGKAYVDTNVENSLLKEALKGNVTAMIFWLKNRKPEKWRDAYQQDIKTNIDIKDASEKYKKYLKEDDLDDN